MPITRPAYCTREEVQRALDVRLNNRARAMLDDAVCSASSGAESLCHRKFYPLTATKYFDWPTGQPARPWRLWLDENELYSLTSITSGGTTISTGSVLLEPQRSGPPYDRIELDISTNTAFIVGTTPQRSVALTGTWHYPFTTKASTTISSSPNASTTSVNVADSSVVGCGDLVQVDSEWMLVTERVLLSSGQTLQTPVTDDSSAATLAVTTGSAFNVGEVLTLDAEQMEITDITGNNLTVERAANGSALATHTGSTIYAPRTLTVVRGYSGSTAASHTSSTALTVHAAPPEVREYSLALATTIYGQMSGGYASPAGSGSNARPQIGPGLEEVAARLTGAWQRMRSGVV